MRRREFLLGAGSVAAYAYAENANALTASQRAILLGGVGNSPLPALALNAPWGAIGDSWLGNGYSNNADNNQVTVWNYVPTALMERAQGGLKMAFKGNKAVGGTTVTQIAASVTAALAAMPGPGLFLVNGGYNNIGNAAQSSDIYTPIITSVNSLVTAGHRVLLLAMAPADPSNPLSGLAESQRVAVNAAYAAIASSSVKVYNADALGLVHADYADQIHLTSVGFDKYATALYAYAQAWFPTGDTRTLTASSYISNPSLAGGTTAPTGWAIDNTNAGGATIVGSKVAGKWRITISGTYTGTGKYISIFQTQSVPPNPAVGELVEALASYTMVGAVTNLCAPDMAPFVFTSGFSNVALGDSAQRATDQLPNPRTSGTYVTKSPQMLTNGLTAAINFANLKIPLPNAVSSTACAGVIDFDYITLRKVP